MASLRCAVLALAVCLSASCLAQEYKTLYKSFKEIPDVSKADDGQRFLMVGEGAEATRYLVVKDSETKNVYFINENTKEPQWHDPRIAVPSEEPQTMDIKIPIDPPKPKGSSLTVAVVAMLPILLFAGGTAARVAYLQMYYPELLWPTKERKDRRKAAGGKVKPQKQRGKMNQDGKGGRSANS
ncbi:hypothetical protein VOLCADRAFT_104886 [Volvox carteri f. nagariensis]|uniref:WW domain-containing protein n=1 Tax=Volvox carteri f. nagariensis TaxID=3068 RepID=D8TWS0_VOLCA|nr:uncharacterized protein VOLCADRAFT_104886 [Volvox carteri f. nagariensis]EFJ48196.1 hypothetical protein VOLCADRAFT_104886 [Volvox carteri f. nagariensis]|eukprot:XP_002950881.1 hypothetical protein VOLCADRAFT_104886 [Volvox carteri f. nagariensis]